MRNTPILYAKNQQVAGGCSLRKATRNPPSCKIFYNDIHSRKIIDVAHTGSSLRFHCTCRNWRYNVWIHVLIHAHTPGILLVGSSWTMEVYSTYHNQLTGPHQWRRLENNDHHMTLSVCLSFCLLLSWCFAVCLLYCWVYCVFVSVVCLLCSTLNCISLIFVVFLCSDTHEPE